MGVIATTLVDIRLHKIMSFFQGMTVNHPTTVEKGLHDRMYVTQYRGPLEGLIHKSLPENPVMTVPDI